MAQRASSKPDCAQTGEPFDLPRIGAEHLTDRDHTEEQTAEDGKQQSQNVCFGIRVDGHIDWNIWNWPPRAQHAEDAHGCCHAANTSSNRNHKSFGEELAEDELPARSKSHADGDFA